MLYNYIDWTKVNIPATVARLEFMKQQTEQLEHAINKRIRLLHTLTRTRARRNAKLAQRQLERKIERKYT